MISITFTGESVQAVAGQARTFADAVLERQAATGEECSVAGAMGSTRRTPEGNWWGYRPTEVRGFPEHVYAPVDDGTEWVAEPLQAWLHECTVDGEKVVEVLAEAIVAGAKSIDPRLEYLRLQWQPNTWSGTWNGVRRAAMRVMQDRNIRAWPWGHTYDEPRRLWMHSDIAKRVLEILENLRRERS